MKILIFRTRSKGKKEGKGIHISVEKILFLAFIAVFSVMLIVQAAMVRPDVRAFLNIDQGLEGTALGAEEYLYKEGDLGLELLDSEGNPDLRVMVNGDEVAAFTNKNLTLKVKDGDVVEIDGSSVQDGAEVEIASKSDNINSECVGKKVKVQSNVVKLIKIEVE